jgi:hypothetical protein
MTGSCLLGIVLSGVLHVSPGFIPEIDDLILRRGDADNNAVVNQTDAIFINNYLFSGGPEPPCLNQADVNDDGVVDVTDPIVLLNWLFNGTSPPAAPGPDNTQCAEDPGPNPGCAISPCE